MRTKYTFVPPSFSILLFFFVLCEDQYVNSKVNCYTKNEPIEKLKEKIENLKNNKNKYEKREEKYANKLDHLEQNCERDETSNTNKILINGENEREHNADLFIGQGANSQVELLAQDTTDKTPEEEGAGGKGQEVRRADEQAPEAKGGQETVPVSEKPGASEENKGEEKEPGAVEESEVPVAVAQRVNPDSPAPQDGEKQPQDSGLIPNPLMRLCVYIVFLKTY
ncbi:MSP7-like protein [Plasmodium brasilianum]|uniref:Uncharacterized protein n=2 Tax=Plasmodium (Plasmodium) TaxID=418103 RepID=A0A1A8W5C5_PLAMA|nr:MSP7-like protein [Plasmodium brasilianum]SBS87980.1 hypothetical protein PMALA_021160 [Plasmodium malariae]